MPQQFTIRQPAGENSRFHPSAFRNQVGKVIQINMPNGDKTQGKMVFANVADDGSFVDLGFETDEPGIEELIKSHYSYKIDLPNIGFANVEKEQ